MELFRRCLFSFSATSCMLEIYAVKELADSLEFPCLVLLTAFFVGVSLGLAYLVLKITDCLELDEMRECETFLLADNDFLPVYLGYFFVALSIDNVFALVFVYLIVFVFAILIDAYFIPLFIVFGYHFYRVMTTEKVTLFVICKLSVRSSNDVGLLKLRRINNLTYISSGGSEK